VLLSFIKPWLKDSKFRWTKPVLAILGKSHCNVHILMHMCPWSWRRHQSSNTRGSLNNHQWCSCMCINRGISQTFSVCSSYAGSTSLFSSTATATTLAWTGLPACPSTRCVCMSKCPLPQKRPRHKRADMNEVATCTLLPRRRRKICGCAKWYARHTSIRRNTHAAGAMSPHAYVHDPCPTLFPDHYHHVEAV